MIRCQWTTERVDCTGSKYGLYSRGGGQCSRRATYTDGKNFVCTQHAKEPATVLRMATGKIKEGFIKIPLGDDE